MAKKKQESKRASKRKKLPEVYNKLLKVGAYDATHRKQLQQRAKKVQQLYKQAVDKIARAAAPSLFDADPAKEFHFSDFPALNKSVEALIDDMGKQLQANIEDGDSDAWTLANAKNDMVVNTLASVYSLPKDTLKEWRHPHLDALQEFEERRKSGMNLSNGGSEADIRKGVWNLDQFKYELEIAIEQGIGQGKSAVDLSRDVRQYLKYPNKLFRRVRDKDGVLRLSKAAAAFHPGRGVYRSSYKNALRLTATENNIAYRTCDHKRWNALPFVLGQEIKTSNNHPEPDICDTLAGKYPIEFKFTGWHPFCRCYAVSILASEKELDDYCSKLEQGTNVSEYQFTGKQTQMPETFTTWMKDNEQRIANAKSMPYFIKDNYKDGDPAKGLRWAGKKETAKQRIFRMAAERHAARTQADKDAIMKRLQARKQKHQQMRDTAQLAMEQIKEMPEVSGKQLAKYIKDGDLDRMYKLALKKINEVNAMKLKEQALEDLIPDVHAWHKKFYISELKTVHDKVKQTLSRPDWKIEKDNVASLENLKKTVEHEIWWMEQPGKGRKYKTWQVSQEAYKKHLQLIEKRIDMAKVREAIQSDIDAISSSKSKIGKKMVADFDAVFANDNGDVQQLKKLSQDIKAKASALQKAKASRAKNATSSIPTSNFVPKSDAETRDDFIKWTKKIGADLKAREVEIDHGFVHLQDDQQERLYDALNVETPAEHRQLWNHSAMTRHGNRGGYVRTGNSFEINKDFRETGITGAIDSKKEAALRRNGAANDDIKTIKMLDAKIQSFSLPIPLRVTRYVEEPALNSIFGEKISQGTNTLSELLNRIKKSAKQIQRDPAYLSASASEWQNVFKNYKIKLEIEVPPNTPLYLTDNYPESEVVFGRSTPLKFINAQKRTDYDDYDDINRTYLVIRLRMVQ